MKKTIFAVLLLAALFVTACTDNSTVNSGVSGFIGGSQGLEIAFYADAPPTKVPDNKQQEFEVIVEVTNKGEDEVQPNEAIIKISGFPPESFGLTLNDLILNPEEVIEANKEASDGTLISSTPIPVIFEGFNYQDVEIASRSFPIKAEICYEYTTKTAAELCIKENFNSNRADDLCVVTADRIISSSGAPIQITGLKQSTAGSDRTRFTFTVQNLDTGSVYKSGTQCAQSTSNDNKVYVKINGLPAGDISCVGLMGDLPSEGYITLVPNQARDISCTVAINNRNNRIQPFTIDLSYAYSKFIMQSILIEHAPE